MSDFQAIAFWVSLTCVSVYSSPLEQSLAQVVNGKMNGAKSEECAALDKLGHGLLLNTPIENAERLVEVAHGAVVGYRR